VQDTLEPPAQYLDRVSDSGSSVGRSYSSASSTQVIEQFLLLLYWGSLGKIIMSNVSDCIYFK
jgi:hypothetical protein